MKNKTSRLNDEGFTLVELLIGVLILALITAPLLRMFISSSKTSNRSRLLGNATAVSQGILETLEATGIDALCSRFGDGTGAALFGAANAHAYGLDAASGAYTPEPEPAAGAENYVLELRGLHYDNSDFDALITMDSTAFAAANTVDVTQYTPIDVIFAQPSGQYDDPDKLAAQLFSDEAVSLSGDTGMTADFFAAHYNRFITIRVARDTDRDEITCTCVYSYSYSYTYTVTITNPDGTTDTRTPTRQLEKTYTYEFFRGSEQEAEGLDGAMSVYYFFYPNYRASGGIDDNITVENTDDLAFSIFLIKQKTPGLNDVEISTKEAAYSAYIRLDESIRSDGTNAKVSTNVNMDIGKTEPTPLGGTFSFEIYRGGAWYRRAPISGELVRAESENRMYGVTVELFPAGADVFADEPVYTFESSKLT